MNKIFSISFFLFISISLFAQKITIEEYIQTYKDIAMKEMVRTGVPAAIKLAQGILETENGNSPLVKKSNNHFGIKCKETWKGPTVSHDDDAPKECFRKYPDAIASYIDHSDFLKTRKHYHFLFSLDPLDYKAWAYGLKKAGYATNPKYPAILIKHIETYKLNDYSLMALGKLPAPPEEVKESEDNTPTTVAPEAPAISDEPVEITVINPAQSAANVSIVSEQETEESTGEEYEIHVVEPKETLRSIAKKYGVTVTQLKEWNKIAENELKPDMELIISQKDYEIYQRSR
ncbi:MAG: glucosaminidase domain-containing protein [Bacteroidetes bacterium]|nr:glucosaminidase domain-containing protein [Bacteroidota bacterium]